MWYNTRIHIVTKGIAMRIVHVFVHVKPDCVDAFKAATLDNASHSIQEPGVVRFDVIQQAEDPTRFVLMEIYRHDDAPAQHKATAHYARWRDTVADMMAEPRTSITYTAVFPADTQWQLPHAV
mgnify:CR=1 FL=1